MNKSRAAVAVALCAVFITALYIFWPSATDEAISPGKQSSQSVALSSTISQVVPAQPTVKAPIVALQGKGVITGEVFSLNGSRIADAEVSLRRMYADTLARVSRHVEEPAITTQTGASGHFAVAKLALGMYAVSVRTGDMAGAKAILIDRYRPAGHVVILLRANAPGLAGIVVGADNAPVAGARVALVTHDGEDVRLAMRAFWETETDSAGAFSFQDLEPGTWQAYVTAEGYAPLLTDAMNAGDTNVRIVLTQGGSVGGAAVWAEDNSPAAGEELLAQFEGVECSEPVSATVEASGRFAFQQLAPGAYRIATADDSITTADGAVRVDAVEGKPITDLEIRLARGGIVRGRVFDIATQEGVAGVLVSADARDTSAAISSIDSEPTDELGNYEIKGLSASGYTLYLFSSSGYQVRL